MDTLTRPGPSPRGGHALALITPYHLPDGAFVAALVGSARVGDAATDVGVRRCDGRWVVTRDGLPVALVLFATAHEAAGAARGLLATWVRRRLGGDER